LSDTNHRTAPAALLSLTLEPPSVKNLPNILTAARILATPYLFWLVWTHHYTQVIWLFIIIGLTDIADGFIARHYHAQSRLGAYLDPIADKLLLSGMFITLLLAGLMEPWLAYVVLGRDLLILLVAGAFYLAKKSRDFPPSVWGKASTFVQIAFLCFRIGELNQIPVHWVVAVLTSVVAGLTVISTIDYAIRIFGKPNPRS
jgi:cardiolipin synthase